MLTLTEQNFAETIKSNETVFVDFWAAWCGPCRQFGPIFERVAAEHPDAVFAKLDTDANQNLSQALGVMSIPTVMAFRGGYLVFNQPGAMNAKQFGDVVAAVEGLDVEELKQQAAAQGADKG